MDWPVGELGLGDGVVLAFVLHLVFSPESLDDFQRLVHPTDALFALHSKGGVLLVAVAQADAEDETAVGDAVEGGDALGQLDRVVQRQQQHRGSDLHIARLGGQAGEQREHGAHLVGRGQVVLPRGDEAEPGIAGSGHLLDAVLNLLGHGLAGEILVGYEESQLHDCSLRLEARIGPCVIGTLLYTRFASREKTTERAGRGYRIWTAQ